MNGAGSRTTRPWIIGAIVVALLSALAPGAVAQGGVEAEPEVVAARERLDAAETALVDVTEQLAAAAETLGQVEASTLRQRDELAELDARVEALGLSADAAFEQHERNRRSYLDAAIAAYVNGMPDSLQLRALSMDDAEDRTQSLALAQTLGDVFSGRAERYRRTGAALTAELRSLAQERDSAAAAAAAAEEDLRRAQAALSSAQQSEQDAIAERDEADIQLEAARERARRRIAEAAERFRLGEIDRAELLRMADRSIAVFDISVRAYDAYVTAARTVDAEQPGCRISWWALAAIGRIETGHGTHGGAVILPNGDVAPRILGPALTGGPFAVVRDSDGGLWDGDAEWDRAVGPMQFIPSTWRAWATDGNGDGKADPHNYYDAATAAARYLCRGARGQPMDTEVGMRAAALSYNRSQRYVNEVVAAARRYGGLADG